MKIGQTPSKRKVFILENTQLTLPHLCPEIQLHLITDSCPLWHATEPGIERLGIGDPYWGFCWAGGQALARYLLDHPGEVAGKRVIDFGAGCGVEAIAAMMSGAAFLLASDVDPLAVEATRLNALVNGVSMETTTLDLVGDPLTGFDVLLAGDMFYDPAFTRSVLSWFAALAARGMKILLGDPSRGNIKDTPVEPLASYQAPSDVDLTGKYLQKTTVYAIASRISR